MRTLNLGIVAHVDAGKTSLTERLLHSAGVIDEIGSVDDGSTRTDSLALERQRGITIRSAVVSFEIGGVAVNLIDTPGHPDFIAEVERVLGVLDGAVLVVSAVEGVQAQTRVLYRTLRRLGIPTLFFANKVDRRGARDRDLLDDLARRISPTVVATTVVSEIGTREATVRALGAGDCGFAERAAELVADHDETVLAAYLDNDAAVPYARVRRRLATLSAQAQVHPVFFGSAITGAGIEPFLVGLTEFLPARLGEVDGPLSGTVFKLEPDGNGRRRAYVRIFSGMLRAREHVPVGDDERKITGIEVFERGDLVSRQMLPAGRIGIVRGLGDVRIGDVIGRAPQGGERRLFAPPSLEAIVDPTRHDERGLLFAALTDLADQDPLINVRQDDVRQEIHVSLYGEVQKEVIQATLADDYGVAVSFRETTTICIERPLKAGAALEESLDGRTDQHPFLATVGLRVEPAPTDAGITYQRASNVFGTMPAAFFTAVEDAVHDTLRQGLRGWQVTDAVVTLTHTGYWPRQSASHGTFDKAISSTAGDFRNLTPLVLMQALRRAGTGVCEPIHRFRLEAPADSLAGLMPAVTALGAVPLTTAVDGAIVVVEGDIPAAQVRSLQQQLPGLSRGEGLLETDFDRYEPVRHSPPPSRPRTDHDPLTRKAYLLRVVRRV